MKLQYGFLRLGLLRNWHVQTIQYTANLAELAYGRPSRSVTLCDGMFCMP